MATDEVTGGARKATKSKLFEFLVHGVRPGMPSGARMPHQGAPMGPPGPPYVGSPSVRPGMPQTVMETTRKRTAPQQVQQQQVQQQVQQQQQATQNRTRSAKRRKMADKILPQRPKPGQTVEHWNPKRLWDVHPWKFSSPNITSSLTLL
ncbi:SWI/SNF-related matrix-associated actin-dependent regulator of chromatin subfamily D member 3 isoform X6 [Balearica regulorum gibbericeps]|uniref:SWI/SNF-related matrix-associated actin-dependent regulator of chromatin subfamily D member 3 isoform X6 n=1 Tax=Balearica regulorum gibbericeps TaxID=100784 RepID=UPI003F60EC66